MHLILLVRWYYNGRMVINNLFTIIPTDTLEVKEFSLLNIHDTIEAMFNRRRKV